MITRVADRTDLSRAAIVDRALSIADAEGLDAVTIRRLGQELGVTPMALYWHVKNKEELLDAMGDRLFDDVVIDAAAGTPGRETAAASSRRCSRHCAAHPACATSPSAGS